MSAPLGNQNLILLDTNPAGTASYARLSEGILSATPEGNEKNEEKSYYGDNGVGRFNVLGGSPGIKISGDRIPGDVAQDYVMGKKFSYGSARETRAKAIFSDGEELSGTVTMADIGGQGGGSQDSQNFEVNLRWKGAPTRSAPVAATVTGATIAAGAAVGATKATKAPGVGNHLAYSLSAQALTQKGKAYVNPFEGTPYTSGDDIVATAGQYLHLWEIDAYDHIVLYTSYQLQAGDIKAA